jgi:uncharacterized membrane protein
MVRFFQGFASILCLLIALVIAIQVPYFFWVGSFTDDASRKVFGLHGYGRVLLAMVLLVIGVIVGRKALGKTRSEK